MRERLVKCTFYLPESVVDEIHSRVERGWRNRWVVGVLTNALGKPELLELLHRPGRPRYKERKKETK